VDKKLANLAITGPQFVTRSGTSYSHRRAKLRSDNPSDDGESRDGWFLVHSILEYMPPWEAFVHPQAGVYQDFYMVRWAAPHDNADFSKVENGCSGVLGATWEPDECLPDELDQLRVAAKQQWVEKQKARELQELKKNEKIIEAEARAKRAAAEEEREHRAKVQKTRLFNPLQSENLYEDLLSPSTRHCWSKFPEEVDSEKEIKSGWPRSAKEYPAGYGPADPPGFCGVGCDCMEDWHLGLRSVDTRKSWIATQSASVAAAQCIQNFSLQQEFVVRRGLVSGNHYLESRLEQPHDNLRAPNADLSRTIMSMLREAAQRIPLRAMQNEEHGEAVIRNLSVAFIEEKRPPYWPLSYLVKDGPPWLGFDAPTGNIVLAETVSDEEVAEVNVTLQHMNDESNSMICAIKLLEKDVVCQAGEM